MGRLSQGFAKQQAVRSSGAGVLRTQIKLDGQTELLKRVEKLSKWSEKDFQGLREVKKRVAKVYTDQAKTNVGDFLEDIDVYTRTGKGPGRKKGHNGNVRQTIASGTLRRSIKVWHPRSDSTFTYAGPRTRFKKAQAKSTNRSDAWFAHIVEGGDSFGQKKTTYNTGVFARTKRQTVPRMAKMLNRMLAARFKKYMK